MFIVDKKIPETCIDCDYLFSYTGCTPSFYFYCEGKGSAGNGEKININVKEGKMPNYPLKELVICNNCKHWHSIGGERTDEKTGEKFQFCQMLNLETTCDFYCGCAERNTDG